MNIVLRSVAFVALTAMPASASEIPKLTGDVFNVIEGDDWTGSLTYLNYQAPFEDVTIPANLVITLTERGVDLGYKYPDEPHANSSMRANISDSGTKFVGAEIISNQVLADGTREIKTRAPCEDMGQKAVCEMTYAFSETRLNIRKMVTYQGESEAFQRNAYALQR